MINQNIALLVVVTGLLLSACSPGIQTSEFSSEAAGSQVDIFKVSINESLLSGDQVLASMAEVTGVAPTGAIVTEWNNSRTGFADNYKVVSISAPILMAAANLGSRFCDVSLDGEVGKPSAERRLYPGVDFSKNLSQLTDAEFDAVVKNMAFKIWGRETTNGELEMFKAYRADFAADLTAAERTQVVRTRHLILGVCTSMLASYESLSL